MEGVSRDLPWPRLCSALLEPCCLGTASPALAQETMWTTRDTISARSPMCFAPLPPPTHPTLAPPQLPTSVAMHNRVLPLPRYHELRRYGPCTLRSTVECSCSFQIMSSIATFPVTNFIAVLGACRALCDHILPLLILSLAVLHCSSCIWLPPYACHGHPPPISPLVSFLSSSGVFIFPSHLRPSSPSPHAGQLHLQCPRLLRGPTPALSVLPVAAPTVSPKAVSQAHDL